MTMTRMWLLMVLVLLLPGCSNVSKGELPGTYIAVFPFGEERLTLNDDGTYFQEVTVSGRPDKVVHKGDWRFDKEYNDVVLEKALSIYDGLGNLEEDYTVPFDGLVLRHVDRLFPWTDVRLGVNPDLDWDGYVKIEEME